MKQYHIVGELNISVDTVRKVRIENVLNKL